MFGFVAGLEGIEIRHINYGFKEWLKTHGEMPTPSDIRRIAEDQQYLETRRLEPPAKKVENIALPPPQKNCVLWAFKTFNEIHEAGLMPALKAHIAELPENKRDDYIKYLKSCCEFPSTFTGQ